MTKPAVTERWPLPVARAYANFLDATELKERHDRAFAVLEVTLKYLSTLYIADYIQRDDRGHRVNAALKGLARPSLGEWAGFLRELIRFGDESDAQTPDAVSSTLRSISKILRHRHRREELTTLHTTLIGLMEKRRSKPSAITLLNLFDLLVRYRNWGLGHGAPLERETYEDLVRVLSAALNGILETLEPITELTLMLTRRSGDAAAAFAAMGSGAPEIAESLPGDLEDARGRRLKDGQLYVQNGSHLCPCHPLVIFESDDVYFLNSGLDEKRLRVEYLSYTTGDHRTPADLEDDQRRLIGIILGYDITREEFTRIVTSLDESPGTPVVDDTNQRVLGEYTLVKELGRGGMGVVYEAFQRSLARRVAIKVLAPGSSPRMVERFERESRATARLHHPNIIPVFDVGEADGTHYFSMALVEGPNVADVLARARTEHENKRGLTGSSRERWDIPGWVEKMRDVALALHYSHNLGMVHRDVKPSNLMLEPGGRLMLLDFGLVKDETEETMTGSGERLGTLRYMSPEQVLRQKVDRRADVWALGTTLYELLTLHPAFEGDNEFEIERAITENEPTRPRKLNRHLSTDLENIVLRALEKKPERRYQNVGELAADLGRFLRYEPVLAKPQGLLRHAGKAILRHRVISSAAAVAVLGIVAFTFWLGIAPELRFGRGVEVAVNNLASADSASGAEKRELLGEASTQLKALRKEHGNRTILNQLAEQVFHDFMSEGRAHGAQVKRIETKQADLEHTWRTKIPSRRWLPEWCRSDELTSYREVRDAEKGREIELNLALTLFDSAFRIAPTKAMEDIAREAKAEALFDQMDRETAPGPEFYASQIRALDVKKYHRKLAGYGKVEIQTQPIGAAVYCFRYENFEERLTPLPFDPVRGYKSAEDGVLAGPALFVEDVFATDRNIPFQSNDEILRVDGQSVEMRSDFARVLENIKVGQEIEVQLRRHGRSRPFPWVPFPKANSSPTETQAITDEDVRIRGIRATFGFSFRTYPLRFLESNRLGMTSTDNPLIADLPRGSYLFVIRKDGYRDTRLPITAPRVKEDGAIETVRLFRDEEIPNGFVQVAGGVFPHGKDREADQALPAGTTSVDDFFIQRHEVTMKEWLDFVTDPGVLPTLDELGRGIPNWTRPDLAPFDPESVREQLRDEERKRLEDLQKDQKAESTSPIKPFEGGQERVSFLPLFRNSDPLFDFENGTYQIKESLEEDYPVLGISHIAAVEFAAWYTRKHGQGRWIFRVPNDLQWEKAARGRDSRYHVWGNYFIPSYCWGHDARRPDDPLNLRPVGYVPSDESVYDVRDMAGSATELTLGLTDDVGRYGAWRGGSWRTATQYFFRIANRNGRQPWDSWHDTGLRLVAEPVSPTKLEQ